MTEDIALNTRFDTFLNDRGDLAIVDGRAAFEQELTIRIKERFDEQIGELDKETAKDLILLSAKRVAQDMDRLDRIAQFEAEFLSTQPNTVEITIFYDTGEVLTFEVDE